MECDKIDQIAKRIARTGMSRRGLLATALGAVVTAIYSKPRGTRALVLSSLQDCGGISVDTFNDNGNCGACGNVCPFPTECSIGRCSCGFQEEACPDGCQNTSYDANNCGACGVVCPSGSCLLGKCSIDVKVNPPSSAGSNFNNTPTPSAPVNNLPAFGTTPPWNIEKISAACSTLGWFAEALPEVFGGFEKQGPYHQTKSEFSVPSVDFADEWYYPESATQGTGAAAFAIVTQLPKSTTVSDAIDSIAGQNFDSRDFVLLGRGTAKETDHPFIVFQVFWPEAGFDVYFAHWGFQTANCLWTVTAADFSLLEQLVVTTISNLLGHGICVA